MAQHFTEDDHIDNPKGLKEILEKMQYGDEGEGVITEAEADELTDRASHDKSSLLAKRHSVQSSSWAPRDEGGASNPKAMVPEVSSKSILEEDPGDEESVDGGHPVDDGGFLTGEGGSGVDIEDAEVEDGTKTPVLDLDTIMEGLSEFMEDRLKDLRENLGAKIELNADNYAELSKTVARLTTKVSVLSNQLASPQAPRTKVVTSSAKAAALPTTPKPVHTRSVSQVSATLSSAGERSHGGIVSDFISNNPNYPRIMVVRKKVLGRLCTQLGFKDRGIDIPPAEWNMEGILRALTTEG